MEHLWSPWRNAYVNAKDESRDLANLFVEIGMSSDDAGNYVIARTKACYSLLNRFPYNLGHLMVIPYRAVPDLNGLSKQELDDLWSLVQDMCNLLQETFKPHGLNVGINIGAAAGAGIPNHMHVHIVPRWTGDANFMTTCADTRLHPGDLTGAYARLKEFWAKMQARPQP